MLAHVSITYADLSGLPPAIVVVGECEIPRDDELVLAKKVGALIHIAKDMPHNPALFADYHPEGQRALDALTGFIRKCLA